MPIWELVGISIAKIHLIVKNCKNGKRIIKF